MLCGQRERLRRQRARVQPQLRRPPRRVGLPLPLQPGEPQRFLPSRTGIGATDYQRVIPMWWPTWGYFDLRMGDNDGPPGLGGACDQGTTYAGSKNEACGAYRTWGRTDLEVWYLVEEGV